MTGGATVYYQDRTKKFRVIVPPENPPGAQWEAGLPPCQPPEDPTIALVYEPAVVNLLPLQADGTFLRTADGRPFTIIQCSDFNILARLVQGEDIEPVLSQRQRIGFNYLRVWTAYNIPRIGRLIPSEHPDLYSTYVPKLLQKAARHGLYVELTAGTGPWGGIFNTETEKVQHWDRLDATCNGYSNASLEVINEADNIPNIPWPIQSCHRPAATLASHGSCIVDQDPVTPVWGIAGFHPGSEPRKWGHNAMERADQFRIPIWSGETVRFPDNNNSPRAARDGAKAAALLCAGSCFHSVSGKTSSLFEGIELECAQAWADGAREVPLEFQRGFYRHRSDLERDDVVRAYSRVLLDGREFVVLIHE